MLRLLVAGLAILFCSTNLAFATPIINELSPQSDPEWVELYNPDDLPFDLGGMRLVDGNSSTTDDLDLVGTISARAYLVFTHTKGWLNDGGDTVTLLASDSATVDTISYTSSSKDQSYARIPDDSENWQTATSTYGAPNPTPTPSPRPSPSPTPPPSPTPTPTPSPSPPFTPKPSPTPSPALVPSPLVQASQAPLVNLQLEGTVAGESVGAVFVEGSPSPTPASSRTPSLRRDRLINVGIIFIGLLLLSTSVFLGYLRHKRLSRAKLEG